MKRDGILIKSKSKSKSKNNVNNSKNNNVNNNVNNSKNNNNNFLLYPTFQSPPSCKGVTIGFLSDSSTITTISTSPPFVANVPHVKTPILIAASALLSLKSNGSSSPPIVDDIMTVMVGNTIQQESSISEDDASSSSSAASSASSSLFSLSCASTTNNNSKTRRGGAILATNKNHSQKMTRVIKATKKTLRKPSLDLTTPNTVASTPGDEPASAYKRIPSKLLKNPSIWKSGMRLAVDTDSKKVNSLHKFVRAELLECFVLQGSYRVGLRCVHCAGWLGKQVDSTSNSNSNSNNSHSNSSMSTFFPKSLQDLYRSVCTWQRIHFKTCPHMPEHVKEKYWRLKDADRTRGKKSHWITSAYGMGFRNVDDNRSGIMYCPTTTTTTTITTTTANDFRSVKEAIMDYESESDHQLII
jgi:hypothetical protein